MISLKVIVLTIGQIFILAQNHLDTTDNNSLINPQRNSLNVDFLSRSRMLRELTQPPVANQCSDLNTVPSVSK
jgi:hypothetical protein